jgi:hypothetical protein
MIQQIGVNNVLSQIQQKIWFQPLSLNKSSNLIF